MSERSGRLQKATALVPMAVLSAAVTAGLVGGQVPTPVAAPQSDTSLPDGTSIPARPSRPRPASRRHRRHRHRRR